MKTKGKTPQHITYCMRISTRAYSVTSKSLSLHKIFCCFLSNSTSQASAPSVVFLQTPDLVAGVPTEVEEGAGANHFLQDPATTRVRNFTLKLSTWTSNTCNEMN